MTNTYSGGDSPAGKDPSEETPPESIAPTAETPPEEQNNGVLPRTGLLWWPVPVLAAAGITLIIAGTWLRSREP